jgi:hypothetical protein
MTSSGLVLAVEVFRPVQWEHADQWESNLADGRAVELAQEVGEAFGAMLDDPQEPFEIVRGLAIKLAG